MLKLSAVTSGSFLEREAKSLPKDLAPRPALEVNPGDVLVSRANGVKALVGVVCSVNQVRRRLMVPDLVFRLVPDTEVLDPGFLAIALASTAARKQIDQVMRGSSGQYKISQADVRILRVPRMPLDEQRRIVAAHAALERRIQALGGVRVKLEMARKAAVSRAITAAWAHELMPLKGMLQRVETGWSPVCAPRPPAADEWGVLKLSAVTSGRFREDEAKALLPEVGPRPSLEVKPGDVLMSRANGVKSLVGVTCTVTRTREMLLIPDLVFRLVANSQRMDPEFLGILLASNEVRQQIDDAMRGSSGQYKISQADVRELLVPSVGLSEQRQAVATRAAFEHRIAAVDKQIAKLHIIQKAVVEDLLSAHSKA
ncbi:hypothetical protein AB0B78_18435 [Streptomyces sp. NPDC040724]|uniref:hypothetical protein n=1 Tax=Streptomyces sp. NPDC040724 TaxID=3155612 RepID=UPI0033EA5E60